MTAAVLVTITNGRKTSPQHDAAAAYIKSVDTVQQQMRVALTKATKAYRDFAGGKIKSSLAPELAQAERTLRTLQLRLGSLPVPEVARHLHALLGQLAQLEVSLAGEVKVLATFAPRFSALVKEAGAAGAALSKALAAVKPPKSHRIRGTKKQIAKAQAAFNAAAARAADAQATAVDAYDAKLAAVAARLRRLRPPLVMAPAYRTQLRTLAASRAAGEALAAELRKTNRSKVAVFGRRFTIATRQASSVAAQEAQIAAVKAYNSRVKSIGSMQNRIQAELARVQRVTG